MDSERLREEKMRRAYLALLTGFVMTGCTGTAVQKSGTSERNGKSASVSSKPVPKSTKKEEVQYMISPAGSGPATPSEKSFSVYSAITVGMPEDDVNKLVAPVLLESGVENALNMRRVFYRIGDNTQFWVEYSANSGLAQRKSKLEPKGIWRRFPSGSIEIAPQAKSGERIAGAD